MKSVGASYNITKELSVSAQYDKVSGTTAGVAFAEDEKIKSYQIGYNLGAVTLSASYTDANNAAGVAADDSQIILVRAGAKF
jgi:predicted porin